VPRLSATAAARGATYADRVTQTEPSPRVLVGVLLDADLSDVGAWLRDAAAFDAAGADALWVEPPSESELDPLAIAAALAVVTFRSLLFVRLPAPDAATPDGASSVAARQLSTVDRLSRGRVRVVVDPDTSQGDGVADLRHAGGDPPVLEDSEGHRWRVEATPDGRAGWQVTRAAAVESGVHGLIVPASPRVLDLLRNPDDDGDRRDLQLAVG
jgi:hypothetical protein